MSTFDKRKDGFENKFVHDEELRFRAEARRNRMLGRWAAEKLGLSGEEAEAYAKSVVMADLAEPGDEDVYRKVKGDFEARNVDVSEHQLRREMAELMDKAIADVRNG